MDGKNGLRRIREIKRSVVEQAGRKDEEKRNERKENFLFERLFKQTYKLTERNSTGHVHLNHVSLPPPHLIKPSRIYILSYNETTTAGPL